MPQGLQVFGQNGNLTLDLSTRVCKKLGQIEIGAAAAGDTGTISVPDFAKGKPWYAVSKRGSPMTRIKASVDPVNLSLSWEMTGQGFDPYYSGASIIYGIY